MYKNFEIDLKTAKGALEKFSLNTVSYQELKKAVSKFGIYQQKNGKFMIRISICGGNLSTENLLKIVEILNSYEHEIIHFSTRQDIQIHGVERNNVYSFLSNLKEKFGTEYIGRGGDTLRNIAVCYFSGISKESIFDTHPYAEITNKSLINLNEAFALPRKFKIAYSCSEEDISLAKYNDLGFLAKIDNNRNRTFSVYLGGGLGRKPIKGFELVSSLSDVECLAISEAVLKVYFIHGNRENRIEARLRFLREKIGDDKLSELVLNEYEKIKGSKRILEYKNELKVLIEKNNSKVTPFETIFLENGSINITQLENLTRLFKKYQIPFIRLTKEQTIVFPITTDRLEMFRQDLLHRCGFANNKIKNILVSCVGNSVCYVGATDPKKISNILSEIFEEEFQNMKLTPLEKMKLLKKIAKEVKISGCLNSCSNHQVCKFGLKGIRKNGTDYFICDSITNNKKYEITNLTINEIDNIRNFIKIVISELLQARID